ncbi:MAG: rhomboid family intramembrane serine protease [Lentisphaeria bacterium]
MFSDRDYARYRRPYSGRAEPSMVKTLIIANVAIFFLQHLSGGTNGPFSKLISLHVPALKQLQLWRLGTHMFAHDGFFHILLNMWGLYIFGKPLEQRVGGNRFLHIYFLSGIIGAAAWLLFNKQKTQFVPKVSLWHTNTPGSE